MTSPALSIYIPVYNAEKYLKHCLDSVLNQTFSDFELYIHDDGSTDSSKDICQSYAQRDPRIRLSRGENGHSLEKMNAFLREARGMYIGFVDNDDYLDLDYFEKMIQMLESKGADCVISSYTLVDSEENRLPWYTPELEDGAVLSREEVLKRYLTTLEIAGFRWNKIYRRSIFTEHDFQFPAYFPTDINGEFELLTYVDKAVLLDHHGYYYRQSATSEVGAMNPRKTIGFLETFGRVGRWAAEQGLAEEGDFYRTWRRINLMFNTWKIRGKFSPSEWKDFCRTHGWKVMIGKSLLSALLTVSKYKNGKESTGKFAAKTLIVWACCR